MVAAMQRVEQAGARSCITLLAAVTIMGARCHAAGRPPAPSAAPQLDMEARAAIDWASTPVAANETVLLLGGRFSAASKISLSPPGSVAALFSPIALQPSDSSLKFVLPPGTGDAAGLAQWDVRVDGSPPYTLNAPQPWWVMGDKRRSATAGGYIRVFGSCMWFDGAAAEITALAKAHDALRHTLDVLGDDPSTVQAGERALRQLADAKQASAAAVAASASRLRLTAVYGGSSAITVSSAASNTSQWSAWFNLPESITPGEYFVAVANRLNPENFVSLGAHGSFVSPAEPNVTTITVVAPPHSLAPKKKVFNVSAFGAHGLPMPGEYHSWTNASVAIERAIAAAANEEGGGIVFFERGTYFLNSTLYGFVIPWGVELQGQGKDLVELIWDNVYDVSSDGSTSCKPFQPCSGAEALFRSPSTDSGAWAIRDLTVYVTGYHNMVFYINNRTIGFEMMRVRATANSFLGSNGPGKGRSIWENVTWGLQDPGPLLVMMGSDYLLDDNDLYCDSGVITSVTSGVRCDVEHGNTTAHNGHCHGSSWGEIRNNRLYNGGTSHFMNQWNQVIFENNNVTGISPISGGQSVGTGPGGGYDQHIYHSKNRVQFVWGNDREIITYDDAGAAYLGAVHAVSASGRILTLAEDARSSFSSEWGGWDGAAVTILNGTGAGTWRRVVHSGIDASAHAGEFSNPSNRTWHIDRPFSVSLTDGQVISITPARSRIIFEKDHFLDGGTVQFYGQAQECVVDSLLGERITGLVAWGQWRGWYAPPCGTMGMPPCPPPALKADTMSTRTTNAVAADAAIAATNTAAKVNVETRLRGQMGNGIMANVQLSYLNNRIAVGNKIVRWHAMGGGSFMPGFQKFYNGASFIIESVGIRMDSHTTRDWTQLAATMAVIYRGNVADSNGGFNVANGQPTNAIRDVVIEGNRLSHTDADKAMQISSTLTNATCIVRENWVPT